MRLSNHIISLLGLLIWACIFIAAPVSASCIDPSQNEQDNFQRCLQQADAGDADAQWRVAMAYENGVGTKPSVTKAFRYHERSANQRHPVGQFNLGRYYDEGLAVNRNAFNAVNWYRQSAEQGYTPAMNALGRVYFDGRGVNKDPERAIAWFKRSASLDDVDGIYNSGYALLYAPVPYQDIDRGLALLNDLAEQGHILARYQLGRLYQDGERVEANLDQARHWFDLAAGDGLSQAVQALQALDQPEESPSSNPTAPAAVASKPSALDGLPIQLRLEFPMPGAENDALPPATQAPLPGETSAGNAYWSWLIGLVLVGIIVYMLFGNRRATRDYGGRHAGDHGGHHRHTTEVSSHATSYPPARPDEQPAGEPEAFDLPEHDSPQQAGTGAPPAGEGFYDDRLIAIAKRELEINDMDIPLWKSVLSEVDGHFERAELLYVKRRVAALLEEARVKSGNTGSGTGVGTGTGD